MFVLHFKNYNSFKKDDLPSTEIYQSRSDVKCLMKTAFNWFTFSFFTTRWRISWIKYSLKRLFPSPATGNHGEW